MATNAILSVALVSHGNHQVTERVADLKAAESKGISFDLRWWTPWPTAIAHGINLPAVVPSYMVFYATGLMSNSDFIEPVPASGIVLVTASAFWWFFISFVGQQIHVGAPSASCRRVWTVMVGTIICSLVGFAWLWGAMRQFDQVPPGHALEGLRYALESEYTLGKIFVLLWASVGILIAAADILARRDRRTICNNSMFHGKAARATRSRRHGMTVPIPAICFKAFRFSG